MVGLLGALLLADGRFPSGAHAHSLGLEAAVAAGSVTGMDDLRSWVAGNLGTVWRTDAAVAVLAARSVHVGAGPDDWRRLDAEVTARTTSPQLREVSRRLGRQLLRAVARTWPAATLAALADTHPDGPHVAVVQGAAAAVAGVADADVAVVTLHGAVQLATSAAVRLLGLDPYAVARSVADLAPHLAAVAAEVTAATGADPADLPAAGAPMLDLWLAHHTAADGRLFAS
jgi:urease accessory protein